MTRMAISPRLAMSTLWNMKVSNLVLYCETRIFSFWQGCQGNDRGRTNCTPHNFACKIGPRRRPKGEANGRSHKQFRRLTQPGRKKTVSYTTEPWRRP